MFNLKKRLPRFSLGFLLLITAIVAVYLGSEPENAGRFGDGFNQPRNPIRVLIANTTIGPNEQLYGKVHFEDWPADKVPEGAVLDADDVIGSVALERFYRGEVIVSSRIVAEEIADINGREASKMTDNHRLSRRSP